VIRRRFSAPVIGIIAILAVAVAAWAYWSAGGSATASASVGSLSAPAVSAVQGSTAGSVKLTFDSQALLNGASDSSITYTVYRSADGTTYAAVPVTSGCYAVSYGTASCTDSSLTGTFRYYVIAHYGSTSTGGWTAQSATAGPVTVSADSAAPVTTASVSPAANAAGWNNTSPAAVTLSADDNGGSGVKEIRYTTDGSAPTSASTLYTDSFNVSVTATVRYFATDNAGNAETAKNLAVKIDTAAPTGGGLTANGSSATSFNTSGTVSLTKVEFTDTNSGLAAGSNAVTRAAATLSGNTCGAFSGATAVTINVSGNDAASLATGCYRYSLTAADVAGNVATPVDTAIVKVDTSAPSVPTLAFSGLSANAFFNSSTNRLYIRPSAGGTFTVTGSSTDADTGVQSYGFGSLNANGGSGFGATQSGNHVDYTFTAAATVATTARTVNATNAAGRTSADASYTILADTTAPSGGTITANGSGSDSYNTTGSVSLSKTDFIDAGSGLASGANAISRASTTLSGGTCGTTWSSPTTVTLTNGKDPATLINGCYRYTLDASDNVGNAAAPATSAAVKVDTSAPTGTVTAPAAGTIGGTVNVTSTTAADTGGSGLASVTFQQAPNGSSTYTDIGTDTAAPYTASWDTTAAANGQYNLRAVITDAAGNTTTTATLAVMVSNTFTVALPGGGSTQTAGGSFILTVTAKAAGVTNTAYTGVRTVTFSGPSVAPDGTAPLYPVSLTFTNGAATASVTLYDAETTTITATSGSLSGTSGSVSVAASGSPGGLVLSSSSLSLSCATSVFQCSLALNKGSAAWTSKVSLTDTWGNPGPKAPTAGTAVTVTHSTANGILTGTSLSITKNTAETTAPFSYTPPSGSGNYTDTITASATGLTSAATSIQGH
jgi:hypothetical protein